MDLMVHESANDVPPRPGVKKQALAAAIPPVLLCLSFPHPSWLTGFVVTPRFPAAGFGRFFGQNREWPKPASGRPGLIARFHTYLLT
jgi:hypothetical protein